MDFTADAVKSIKKEKLKMKKGGLKQRELRRIPLVKIREIRVSHPCLSVSIRGLSLALKIKSSANGVEKTVQVNKGKLSPFAPKKFAIFLPALLPKYWANPPKTAQKTYQNTPQNRAI